jgi:hypothetical protein
MPVLMSAQAAAINAACSASGSGKQCRSDCALIYSPRGGACEAKTSVANNPEAFIPVALLRLPILLSSGRGYLFCPVFMRPHIVCLVQCEGL